MGETTDHNTATDQYQLFCIGIKWFALIDVSVSGLARAKSESKFKRVGHSSWSAWSTEEWPRLIEICWVEFGQIDKPIIIFKRNLATSKCYKATFAQLP